VSKTLALNSPTDSTDELHAQAVTLYRKFGLDRPRIRRVGIRVEGLVNADQAYCQPTLDAPERGWREAELATDAIRRKFGPHCVQRAVLTRNGYASTRA
ncbi:MAG TPA: DNA polymerase IV, partial [Micropruina sp.]|nr:DNA polymerase IV [Micropruina sp.]